MRSDRLAVRWTVGDVSARGFEALRLSVLGARRAFGGDASYAICLNSLPLEVARARLGTAADLVSWHLADERIPDFLRERLDRNMAEGVAWKLAPLRLFRDRYEISLDNDCILWRAPSAVQSWLAQDPPTAPCVLAEDVRTCFGWFAPWCGAEPRNTGIRGLPPGFDLEAALREALARAPGIRIAGEVDEQGLQVAALSLRQRPLVVSAEEVTICSPAPPHVRRLGACGAHFVGLNMTRPRPALGCDRALLDAIAANWDFFRPAVENLVGAQAAERACVPA